MTRECTATASRQRLSDHPERITEPSRSGVRLTVSLLWAQFKTLRWPYGLSQPFVKEFPNTNCLTVPLSLIAHGTTCGHRQMDRISHVDPARCSIMVEHRP